jgi:hypothetical protein
VATMAELKALAEEVAAAAADTAVKAASLQNMVEGLPAEIPAGEVELVVGEVTADSIAVSWITASTRFTSWMVGRNGTDSGGTPEWETMLPIGARDHRFNRLNADTVYTITLTPMSNLTEQPISVQVRTKAVVSGSVSDLLGWGAPSWRDEFDYTGDPDPARWMPCGKKGVGWDGHNKNGRRMPECSTVRDGMLVMTGKDNGHTGWLRALNYTKYGRWEVRCRSRNTGPSGATYHPLNLAWPTEPELWPDNGELDFLEVTNPDSKQAGAWLHYPHPKSEPIQQAGPFNVNCDMTQFHVFNYEWDKTGVRAWIDGNPWYDVRDGAGPHGRKNIQDMTKGMFTIQLDNFSKYGPWRPAVFEVDYVRFFPVR